MDETRTGNDGGEEPDRERVRVALGRLAGAESPPVSVVRRAEAALDDLERAAEFVESGGLDELEAAVTRTDDEALAARGERALGSFRRFRAAAAGELDPAAGDGDAGHFHRGRGTDLRRDGEATST